MGYSSLFKPDNGDESIEFKRNDTIKLSLIYQFWEKLNCKHVPIQFIYLTVFSKFVY